MSRLALLTSRAFAQGLVVIMYQNPSNPLNSTPAAQLKSYENEAGLGNLVAAQTWSSLP